LSPAAKEASGLTQFGLFWAARADHLEKKIKPALAQGINVVSDRFDSSSYAFQIHGQQMFPLEKIFMQMREICLAETKPDLYLILDVNPHISVSRMFGRGKAGRNHFDERDVEFHRRVRAAFRNLPAEFPKVVISSHDPVEEVKTRVKAVVDSVLKGEQGQLFDLL
jgi:dTMP kinase